MNIMFWALMISMLLLAIALLVYPLLKVRQHSSLAYKDSNLKINEEKLAELNNDLEEGRINQVSYKVAREELDRELLIDIPAESKQTAAQHYTSAASRHPVMALSIALFVPMLVLLIYLKLGMHAASEENFSVAQSQQQSQQQMSVEEMVQKFEAQIAEDGGSVEDWTMLARGYKYLGRNDAAAKAFAVALETDTENAQLILEMAEVIALNNDRVFNSEARNLVQKAYSLEPDNANVLWFIGVVEFQQGNYHQAIKHLIKLLPLTHGEKDVVKSIVSVVAESRQQLVDAGEEMPKLEVLLGVPGMGEAGSPLASPVATSQSGATGDQSSVVDAAPIKLTVAVDISTQAREKFSPDDTIFVYAKAKQGPRMPLAVQRLKLSELPATVILDDSMAMMEGMNLSSFKQLLISARVTKTGSAIARSGDYIGSVDVDNSDQDTIKIVIDSVVP